MYKTFTSTKISLMNQIVDDVRFETANLLLNVKCLILKLINFLNLNINKKELLYMSTQNVSITEGLESILPMASDVNYFALFTRKLSLSIRCSLSRGSQSYCIITDHVYTCIYLRVLLPNSLIYIYICYV